MATITYKVGDIFTSECGVLVCPIDRTAAMGAGLAKQFNDKTRGALKTMVREYAEAMGTAFDELALGDICMFPVIYDDKFRVLCIPTKHSWSDKHADLALIVRGLHTFRKRYERYGIKSVAFPALGCGLGGLDWGVVSAIICAMVQDLPGLAVELWSPQIKEDKR